MRRLNEAKELRVEKEKVHTCDADLTLNHEIDFVNLNGLSWIDKEEIRGTLVFELVGRTIKTKTSIRWAYLQVAWYSPVQVHAGLRW